MMCCDGTHAHPCSVGRIYPGSIGVEAVASRETADRVGTAVVDSALDFVYTSAGGKMMLIDVVESDLPRRANAAQYAANVVRDRGKQRQHHNNSVNNGKASCCRCKCTEHAFKPYSSLIHRVACCVNPDVVAELTLGLLVVR